MHILSVLFQMIGDIDKDGSGSIDFEEFLDMMTAKMVSHHYSQTAKPHTHPFLTLSFNNRVTKTPVRISKKYLTCSMTISQDIFHFVT